MSSTRKAPAPSPGAPDIDLSRSNWLAELAARIRAEHEATALALKRGVEHGMAAGDLLLEAKAQVPHGQWLPWLAQHCTMSERTAQLYMRLAKNRPVIEAKAQCIADLTLNAAAALPVLTSKARKLLDFAKRLEAIDDPEKLVSACAAEGIGTIRTPNYDPFAGRSDQEVRDWHLFALFLGGSRSTADHIEWILHRPFQNVDEWLGEEGDKFRKCCRMRPVPEKCREAWRQMHARYCDKTLADIELELRSIAEREGRTA